MHREHRWPELSSSGNHRCWRRQYRFQWWDMRPLGCTRWTHQRHPSAQRSFCGPQHSPKRHDWRAGVHGGQRWRATSRVYPDAARCHVPDQCWHRCGRLCSFLRQWAPIPKSHWRTARETAKSTRSALGCLLPG